MTTPARTGSAPSTARTGSLVAEVVFLALVAAALAWGAAGSLRSLDWSVGGGWAALYVVAALNAGGLVLALLTGHGPLSVPRRVRGLLAGRPIGIRLALLAVGVAGLASLGASFAEPLECVTGSGQVVEATFTPSAEGHRKVGSPWTSIREGTYTAGGATHDLTVKARDVVAREVAPAIEPYPGHPRRVRTYRVPWIGSDYACGTPLSPDRGRLVATSALGLLLGLLAMASGRTLVHRRTQRTETPT